MGALTSKQTEFAFRTWEPRTAKEVDDTEIFPFRIRTEKLKLKKFRILLSIIGLPMQNDSILMDLKKS